VSVLYIEPTDFTSELYGSGGKAIASSAIRVVGNKLWLVGVSSNPKHVIGKWTTININNNIFNFMPVVKSHDLNSKISLNMQFAFLLARSWKKIQASNIKSVFLRCSAVLWCLSILGHSLDICFFYPGVNNPMYAGRKQKVGKYLAPIYDIIQARAVRSANVILAAADSAAIREREEILRKYGTNVNIQRMPTAVNTSIFRPQDKINLRRMYGFQENNDIFVFVGRLAKVKGINFLIESLFEYNKEFHNASLIVLGDGEEKDNLQLLTNKLNLHSKIHFLGNRPPKEVADYIGCSDCCVVGSYAEGFSNAMIEEIACGRPVVSTNISGATDLIMEGENGFIVNERDPILFANRMHMALNLNNAENISRELAINKYSEEILWKNISELWTPLS
jgi:glycosyltransferase involved in cell wall biosynthesis